MPTIKAIKHTIFKEYGHGDIIITQQPITVQIVRQIPHNLHKINLLKFIAIQENMIDQ